MGFDDIRLWRDPVLGVVGTELLAAHSVRHCYRDQIRDEAVVVAVTGGSLRYRIGDGEGTAIAGTVLVIPSGEVFGAEPASEDGWSCRMFYPDVRTLTAIATEPDTAPPRRADSEPGPLYADAGFAQHLATLHQAIEINHANALARQQAFAAAMAMVLRHCAGPAGWSRRRTENNAIHRAVECVRARFSDPRLSIDDLAAAAGCSPYHFMRSFRAAVGITAHDYVVQCRLAAARRMLADGIPAAEVASAAGFADQSHLNRRFRVVFGITPGQYEKECRRRRTSPAPGAGMRLFGTVPERHA